MAKKTTTVVIPKTKRLPQGNIRRLVEILMHQLREKAAECYREGNVNKQLASKNYLTAAIKKYGMPAVATVKLTQTGILVTEPTAKTKKDLKRIQAPYERVCTKERHFSVPASKVDQFEAALQNIRDLEILLLTADSDEAVVMFDTAEQQIQGIK